MRQRIPRAAQKNDPRLQVSGSDRQAANLQSGVVKS